MNPPLLGVNGRLRPLLGSSPAHSKIIISVFFLQTKYAQTCEHRNQRNPKHKLREHRFWCTHRHFRVHTDIFCVISDNLGWVENRKPRGTEYRAHGSELDSDLRSAGTPTLLVGKGRLSLLLGSSWQAHEYITISLCVFFFQQNMLKNVSTEIEQTRGGNTENSDSNLHNVSI